MKKIIMWSLVFFSTLSFAHEKTKEDKKAVYNVIKKQLDERKIDIKTAQKIWKTYLHCCKKPKKGAK